jgi:hypothetical protein
MTAASDGVALSLRNPISGSRVVSSRTEVARPCFVVVHVAHGNRSASVTGAAVKIGESVASLAASSLLRGLTLRGRLPSSFSNP